MSAELRTLPRMISCERKLGRLLESTCGQRWRIANGQQDGPKSVQSSVCRCCPHGQARAGVSAAPLPVHAAQEIARVAAAREDALPAPALSPREKRPATAGLMLSCKNKSCGKQFPANTRGPRRSMCYECKPSFQKKPLAESATCARPSCGKSFAPNTHGQRYCSPRCQKAEELNRYRQSAAERDEREAQQQPPAGEAQARKCEAPRCDRSVVAENPRRRYCCTRCQRAAETARRLERESKTRVGGHDLDKRSNDASSAYRQEPAQELPPAEFELRPTPAVHVEAPESESDTLRLVCQNPECLKAFASPNKFGPKRRFCGQCVPPDGAAATCAREACGTVFVLQWRQQRYCSARCQKLGEQERAKQRYTERVREARPVVAGPSAKSIDIGAARARFIVRFEVQCDDVASVVELAKALGLSTGACA